MTEPSYLFGNNFRQDNSSIYIAKKDYPGFLTANNSSGQDAFVYLLKRWIKLFFGELEDHQERVVTDHENKNIEFDHSWIDNFCISLARQSIKYKDKKNIKSVTLKLFLEIFQINLISKLLFNI